MSVFKSFKPDLRKLFNIHALKMLNFAQNISQYFRKSSIWFQWSICRMTKWFCHPLRPLCTDYSNQIVYKKLYQKAIIKNILVFQHTFPNLDLYNEIHSHGLKVSGFSYQPCRGGFVWKSGAANHPRHKRNVPREQQAAIEEVVLRYWFSDQSTILLS